MTMHKRPLPVFNSIHARDPQAYGRKVISGANSGAEALDFDHTGEVRRFVRRDAVEADQLAFSIAVRGGARCRRNVIDT